MAEWQTRRLEGLVGHRPRESSTLSLSTKAGWRNVWQTRRVQAPVTLRGRAGSTPVPATNAGVAERKTRRFQTPVDLDL